MTKIYIVRHCQTLGNVKDLFQVVSDFDITEKGYEQLKCLTERFSNIHLDKVYSSPLIRTQKTAKAIIGNRDIPLKIKDSLIEIDGGYIEGKPFDETFAVDPELYDTWFNHPQNFAPEGGEPMTVSYQRIWEAVQELLGIKSTRAYTLMKQMEKRRKLPKKARAKPLLAQHMVGL